MRQAISSKQTNRVSIWHLGNKMVSSVRLYQSDETHYIVTQDGEWTPIISCGLFVIVNQALLTFFQQQLEEQVSVMDVSIYDRVLDQVFDGYNSLYIPNAITPETI